MKRKNIIIVFTFIVIGLSALAYYSSAQKTMAHQRDDFIAMKKSIVGELIQEGEYACCLEKPCTYCIEKTPGHGEGASCHCLDDVMNGRHPCGECIGEIIEGHGNKFLAKFFAWAITEEVGEEHHEALKGIISSQYDIPANDQL